MGASQSSERGTGDAATRTVKTSYYELIGVSRSATDDEIKKAYRRKALELHPDRNFGNEEESTKIFAEVQAAYEVLSDPQERAWYDSHESAILRGDDGAEGEAGAPAYENVRITTADDLARLVRKFNAGIPFTDAPSGFFGFVRETFEQLAKEEEVAGDWDGVEVVEMPSFGHKDDEYEDVVKPFYTMWQNFSTVKSFSWKDKYRLSEAPDRWMRRRMEQENKKLRQDGVREFNDAVRSLVAFIRKRDPRYVPSTQTEQERQKILRDAAAAQAARARAANAAKLNEDDVPEWTKFREPEELEESEEEIIEQHIFECVACNKEFKSERQWEAHEKSKKHQKAIFALQKKMRKDNATLHLDEVASTPSRSTTPEVLRHDQEDEATNDSVTTPDEGDSELEEKLRQTTVETTEPGKVISHATAIANDEDAPTKDISLRGLNAKGEEPEEFEASHASADSSNDENDDDDKEKATSVMTGKKLGKAAQKRAKKAAAAALGETSDTEHKCATCNAAFPSKTRLFQHIKDFDHAAPKSAGASIKGKKGRSKR